MIQLDRSCGYFDESFERRSREVRKGVQDKQVVEIVKHAYENCQAFKQRCALVDVTPSDIKGVNDLQKIPVLRKDDLIGLQQKNPPFGGLLGVPEDEVSWIFMSPGPIFDPVLADDERREKAVATALYSCGFRKGDKVLNAWSYHMVPAGIWNDLALRYMGCTVIPTGVGNTELQVEILRRLRVSGFLGTTGFLMNVLNKAEEMDIDPGTELNLQVALVGGEAGGAAIRSILEDRYGIVSRDFYGTADIGLVAYECTERSGMHLIDNVVVEIADPETGRSLLPGEVGEVVITSFNRAYPMIRFGTGDLSELDIKDCPCGRTSVLLTKIVGRIGDAVRVRGMFIHPKQTQQMLSSFSEIGAFQMVVTRPKYRDYLTLKIEGKDELQGNELLKTALFEKFKEVCRVSPDEIIFVEAGGLANDNRVVVDDRKY